jgi:hypothetical protein
MDNTTNRAANASTKLRCKPGDRCLIVAGGCDGLPPLNIGRVVVVVRAYARGEYVGGVNDWLPDAPDGGRHWVVASLGDGLRSQFVKNGVPEIGYEIAMTTPIADCRLMPLDDDEGGIEESALRDVLDAAPLVPDAEVRGTAKGAH